MRRLCWNLETGAVTLSITSGQSIGTLRVKRHDLEDLEVVPYRSSTGAACDLPSGASLVFALKETSTDTVLLTSCVSWTLAANTYSGTVSLNTTEIDDAFDAAPTATEIPCVAELIYVIAGQQRSSQTITAPDRRRRLQRHRRHPHPRNAWLPHRTQRPRAAHWRTQRPPRRHHRRRRHRPR
jgi:hypothetical protein